MLNRESIKQILLEQRLAFLNKETGIRRSVIESIESKLHLPHIHVITGIRRCGKSTLLRQVAREFYNDEAFFYINFEDERLINFNPQDFNDFYEVLVELFGVKKTFLIDEVQHVRNFDSFIRRFYDNGFKFFITGSNAGLLKEEISTRLTGRHIDSYLTPFSFKEFLDYHQFSLTAESIHISEKKARIKSLFQEYFVSGGMPEFVRYKDTEILRHIYDDIVTKDIFIRNKVENVILGKELYRFLISNFAQRFSYNSLLKYIPLGSVNTIKRYVHFLEDVYLALLVSKFDYSVKKQFANEKKLYITDNGFIRVLSIKPGADQGWLLENLVRNNLSFAEEVFYYSGKKECDFVLMNNKKVGSAIQVSMTLDRTNKDREIKGLLEAMGYFNLKEGLLLTFDQDGSEDIQGRHIMIKPVWKFLLEGQVGTT